MPTKEQYYRVAIVQARENMENFQKEAIDHLQAVSMLDHDDALDSLATIEKAVKEVAYYVDRIYVLSRLHNSAKQ